VTIQPSEWEKIIANEATDKELTSKIYEQLLQPNSRKINDQSKMLTRNKGGHYRVDCQTIWELDYTKPTVLPLYPWFFYT